MKIYFARSINGDRGDTGIYEQIISLLGEHGEVLTEDTILGKDVEPSYVFERDGDWIRDADVVVAEVTIPSLGVGYEIGLAESLEKRILCIYREKEDERLSSMIAGNRNLSIAQYENISDLENIFTDFF